MTGWGKRRLRWAGFFCFYVGAVLTNARLTSDTLPINRALFATDCGLIATWLLVLASRSKDERSD